jgi:hypothetical protein
MAADGFPRSVKKVFRNSGLPLFKDVELLLAFPEYTVSLVPRGSRPSQNDIFVLARGNDQLITMAVEGKVDEPFGDTLADWDPSSTPGKRRRFRYLCDLLDLPREQLGDIRYQLLHRTASAVIEARKFGARGALMLVHSFDRSGEEEGETFQDYCRFLDLFGVTGRMDSLVLGKNVSGIDLYFAWVDGEKKYLED